jgi:tetratricopeptide (TPR) repeat protein
MAVVPDWKGFLQQITEMCQQVTSPESGAIPVSDPTGPELHPAESGAIQALELAYRHTLDSIPTDLQDVAQLSLLVGHAKAMDLIGDWGRAHQLYEKALVKATLLENHGKYADIWRQIGRLFRKQGRWTDARQAHQQAISTYDVLHDRDGLAAGNNSIGAVFMEEGELRKAQRHFEKALEYLEGGTNYTTRGLVLNNLGIVANIRGKWDLAITRYQEAITFYDRIADRPGVARAYQNLGMTFADRDEWLKANEYFEKSLDITRVTGDRNQKALIYLNKIEVYIHLGDLALALIFCNKCLQIFSVSNDMRGVTEISKFLGVIHRIRQEWKASLKFFEQAVRLSKEYQLWLTLGETQFEKGLYYRDRVRFPSAVKALEASIDSLKKAGAQGEIRKVRKELSRLKRKC